MNYASSVDFVEFIEAPEFTKYLSSSLDPEEYRRLQFALIENPVAGKVMPKTGGFRKVRWYDARRGKGKRSGLRIIYYYFPDEQQIFLVTLYDKDQADDLTPAQKKMLQAAIHEEVTARAAVRKTRARPLIRRSMV